VIVIVSRSIIPPKHAPSPSIQPSHVRCGQHLLCACLGVYLCVCVCVCV
jgi:hypothetical protein